MNDFERNEYMRKLQEEVDEKFFEMQSNKKKTKKKSFWKELFLWIEALVIAAVFAYLLNAFVFERALVDGQSMYPTLEDHQSLFEYKLNYYFNQPQRGDIIIMEYDAGKYESRYIPLPDDQEVNYVKRIIGLPGEVVDIRSDGHVYINDQKLEEPYLTINSDGTGVTTPGGMQTFPITLGADEYFVMGDNRSNSRDSREIGPINRSQIRGEALAIILPFEDIRLLK